MNQAVAKALFSGLLICISVSNSGATANAGPLDYSGSLDASMLQGLLQSASTGFAHIAVTKDDSLSDENSDWYDVTLPLRDFRVARSPFQNRTTRALKSATSITFTMPASTTPRAFKPRARPKACCTRP